MAHMLKIWVKPLAGLLHAKCVFKTSHKVLIISYLKKYLQISNFIYKFAPSLTP